MPLHPSILIPPVPLQAIVLLAGYALRAAVACTGLGASRFERWDCPAASPFQAFVAWVVGGSSALAAAVAAMLLWGRTEGLAIRTGRSRQAANGENGSAQRHRCNGVHHRGQQRAQQGAGSTIHPSGVEGSMLAKRAPLAPWRLGAAVAVLLGGALALLRPVRARDAPFPYCISRLGLWACRWQCSICAVGLCWGVPLRPA